MFDILPSWIILLTFTICFCYVAVYVARRFDD